MDMVKSRTAKVLIGLARRVKDERVVLKKGGEIVWEDTFYINPDDVDNLESVEIRVMIRRTSVRRVN
jgi:hypothetical protein